MPSVELADMPRGTALLDHSHPTAHIMIVLEGAILEDGRVYEAGDVRFSAAGDKHFLRFTSFTRCVVIEGAESSEDLGTRRLIRAPDLARALQGARGDLTLAPGLAAKVEARCLAGLNEPPAWLREVEGSCKRHGFVHARSVQEIAREAGVSREHLARSYQKHFGTSISEAVRIDRLKRAYDGVVRSDIPLAEVAAACGFADQSHMTRLFAAWIGVTPGSLRTGRETRITSVQDRERLLAVF